MGRVPDKIETLRGERDQTLICYEVFVRSFRDGNGDGVGDIRGLIEALDYLEWLGVDIIWLTPIFSSPSYHGYDVTDYIRLNPLYGNDEDFDLLVTRLKERGFKLVLDIPLHHTSRLHRWFDERPDFYVWADEKTDINEKREWDGVPIWHPSKRGYYRGLFGPCMPDLNYENREVVEIAKEIVSYWKGRGVDGFRFDAAKHIYEDHEQNLEFWRSIGNVIGSDLNVAEVWDSPEIVKDYAEAVGYAFNFHIFGAIRKSIRDGKPDAFYEALLQVKEFLMRSFNFISNHDVTRIASEVPHRKGVVFAYSILMTLPGIPVIYYGDELGIPGIYDPKFSEDVTEPFPWCEEMCGKGQTMWKSLRYTKPFHGLSLEYQREHDGIVNEIRKWVLFRKERFWIDRASIKEIYVNESSVVYTINWEDESLKVTHDFSKLETEIL